VRQREEEKEEEIMEKNRVEYFCICSVNGGGGKTYESHFLNFNSADITCYLMLYCNINHSFLYLQNYLSLLSHSYWLM
jgi:hypothetical protein